MAERLLSVYETLHRINQARGCTPLIPDLKVEAAALQGHPPLTIKFEAILGYMRPFLKQNKAKHSIYYNLFFM